MSRHLSRGERGIRPRVALAVSAVAHLGLLLSPLSWFAADQFGAPGEPVRVVSFELVSYDGADAEEAVDPASQAESRVPEAADIPETPETPNPVDEKPPATPEIPQDIAPPDVNAPEFVPPQGVEATGSPVPARRGPAGPVTTPAQDGVPGTDGAEGFRPPRILVGALPLSAEEGRALDVPEEIHVRLRIGRDGRVNRVEAADADLAPEIVEAIRRAAEAMRFIPARRGREPVEAWFSMAFVFRD